MKKLICWFKGHSRDKEATWSRTPLIYWNQRGRTYWHIECTRCGYRADYDSPRARLVGKEISLGFDGK